MHLSKPNLRRLYGSIIFALLTVSVFVAAFNIQPASGVGDWWNASWLYRKMVTLDHTKVTGDLTNFPVLIDTADSDLASKAQSDGDDIAFVDDAGNQLDHEIELYDDGSGHLVAWVNVTSLSSVTDTIFYMYYGNAGASNQENPTGVWDSNYVMVQHLSEISGLHYDSTSYNNDGTPSVTTQGSATGKINGADDFDGTNDYVRVPNDSSLQFGEGSFTAEAWIKPATGTDNVRIVNNRGTGAGGSFKGWHLKIKQQTGQWRFSDTAIDDAAGNYKVYEGTSTYTYEEWHYVVMVYEADSQLRLYVDGSLDSPGTLTVGTYGSITNSLPTAIGAALAANGVEGTHSQWFDGVIDEVRLSNVVRSADWVSTSYNNQHDPGSFHSIGTEERAAENRVTLNSPLSETVTVWTVDFNFTPTFYQTIQNASLYTNETGSWQAVKTIYSVIANQSNKITHTFPHTGPYYLEEGTYKWNVEVWNSTAGVFSSNNSTVTIDVPPRYRNVGSSTTTPYECNPVTLYGEAYDGIGLDTAWLWTNETGGAGKNYTDVQEVWCGNGTVAWMETGYNTQRGILYKGKLYDTEKGGLYIRNWTTMEILDYDSVDGFTNVGPTLDYSNEEIVYTAWPTGDVVAYNTTSQTRKWTTNLGHDIQCAIIPLVEGHLFVLAVNYTLFKLDTSDGSVADVFYCDYYGSGTPKMLSADEANKRIYTVGYSKLHCINATDMTEIWHYDLPAGAGLDGRSSALVINDTDYSIQLGLMSAAGGKTYNLDFDGNLNWDVTIPGGVRAVASYSPRTKYVYIVDCYSYGCCPTNHLYAFNVTTGEQIWKITAPRNDHFFRPLTIVGDYGFVHTNNYANPDYLYVFNMTDGSYIGEVSYFVSGEGVYCYPIIVSEGKAITGGASCLIQFDLGEGEYVDYKYLYGNSQYNYIEAQALLHYGNETQIQSANYDSPIKMNGAAKTWTWSNFTWHNSSITAGTTIQWRIYYNDTGHSSGHVVGTDIHAFTVTARPPAVWWNTDWPYRKPITIDHTKVATDCGTPELTDFPVLIDITDSDLASHAQSDGDDIAFADLSGSKLDHEIEFYTSGHLVAWVRVPSLNSTEDTVLYMYYGNAGASNQENPTGVWDSNYVMVQHLEETSGTHYDSTSNNNDGTYYGATQDAAGKIDGADEFDGVNDYVDVGTGTSLDVFGSGQDFSVFLWVKRDDLANMDGFFSSGSSSSYGVFFGSASGNWDDLRFLSKGNTVDEESTANCIGDYEWHMVGITADRDGNLIFYADGVAVHTADISAHLSEDWNRADDTYKIGTDRSETGPADGVIDEVRVSDVVRIPCWISTSYNNQHDPSSFYAVGPQEMQEAKIYIDPPLIEKTLEDVCTTFNINVMIEDVTDLWAFDFNLTWDNTLITLVDVEFNTTLDNIWGPFDEDNWYLAYNETGIGYYELAAVSTSSGFTSTGATALATLTFHVEDSVGETPIHFAMVKLSNSQWQHIPVETTDGTYRIYPIPAKPDLEIIDGEEHEICDEFWVEINVTHVTDLTDFIFTILYNDTCLECLDCDWTDSVLDGTKTCDYSTPGSISGTVGVSTPWSGESGLLLKLLFHVRFTEAVIWKTDYKNVTAHVWFSYAKLSFYEGPDIIYEEGVAEEYIDVYNKTVRINLIQGDIDSDGDVDIFDLRTVAAYYDVEEGDPNWTAASAYDLNGDLIIDIFDLVIVASNFGH